MAENRDDSDEMIDAFFDFEDMRTFKPVAHLKLVPKPRETRKPQNIERERGGTEYAIEHQRRMDREMSRVS